MKVSLNWLKDYVDFDLSGPELAARLSESLAESEFLRVAGEGVDGIVAAKVVTVDRHPEAETLSVCVVDWGVGSSTVVCGAPNVHAGMMAVLAPPGATIAEGRILSEQTIRGRRSHGMLVSAQELGLEEASEGLIELDPGIEPGSDVRGLLGLGDAIIDVDVSPNRPDCLGVLGLAREVAAIVGAELVVPDVSLEEAGSSVEEMAAVEVEDPQGCPRYIARVITDLEVGPSPVWMQTRLRSVGQRSISNVVDVTNFLMLEYGQPIHAFDYDRLQTREIVVRRARAGEVLVTLDGEERKLGPKHLLICDGPKPAALAGIMGGGETEVSEATKNVLLECAWFDPVVIRRGAADLGLQTDASMRFEHGVDVGAMDSVAARASALMSKLAKGRVARGSVDVGTRSRPARSVILRPEKVRAMLTDEVSDRLIVEHLERLGFGVEVAGGSETAFRVSVPSHRLDVEMEADLIEEVARAYGYDRIAPVVPYQAIEASPDRALQGRDAVREAMVGLGFTEVITTAFVRPQALERMAADAPIGSAIELSNPVNKEYPLLRPSAIPGLLDVVRRNANVGERDLRIFEIGKVFRTRGVDFEEKWVLAGAMTGRAERRRWEAEARQVDFYDGKGVLWALAEGLKVDSPEAGCYDGEALDGRSGARLHVGDRDAGVFGMLSRDMLEAWELSAPVFVFELDLDLLSSLCKMMGEYAPAARFPRVRRDIALIVDEAVLAGDVLREIGGLGEPLLVDVEVFDVFRGKQLGATKKSIGFALTYMSPERTLTDAEVDDAHRRVIDRLVTRFEASLRE
jgi:phenylalanyl-tRNA synthetase beta chain